MGAKQSKWAMIRAMDAGGRLATCFETYLTP